MGGSSEEFWTMGESLIQLYRVGDEGYFDRKTLSSRNHIFYMGEIMSWLEKEAPANSVPAAAVIQKEQVLFGIIGRKGRVGCCLLLFVKLQSSPLAVHARRSNLSVRGENRISSGEVKFLEIRRNTKSEGNFLAHYWRWGAKARGANRIRYPGSPRRKRCWFLFGRQKNIPRRVLNHSSGYLINSLKNSLKKRIIYELFKTRISNP